MGRKIDPRFLQGNQPGQNQQYPQVGQQPAPQQPPPIPLPVVTQVQVVNQNSLALEGIRRQGRAMVFAVIGIFVLGPIFGTLAIIDANIAARLGYPNPNAKALGIVAIVLHAGAFLLFMSIAAWTTLGSRVASQ